MENYKDLRAMINKYKLRRKKSLKAYRKSSNELNALVEKKFQKFVKNKKRRKTEKSFALPGNKDFCL